MGKKSKTKEETETDTNTDSDSDTDTNKNTNASLFDKFNKLSRKAKLYIGICVVLLLAGLYMWYKNKNNTEQNIENINNELVPVQQTQMIQQGGQQSGQNVAGNIVLSHLTPNPLEN